MRKSTRLAPDLVVCCSRRGCGARATRVFARATNPSRLATNRGGIYYCDLHYRFQTMTIGVRQCYRVSMTIDQIESLYEAQGKPTYCPRCLQAYTLHQDVAGHARVMSLQHDDAGTLSFLCAACNSGHGQAKDRPAYLALAVGQEKYCARCDRVLPLSAFCSDRSSKDGHHHTCKPCEVKRVAEYTKRTGYVRPKKERQ